MSESIPPEELETFRPYMRVYSRDAPIIVEGQLDDMALFLLREGEVQVFKQGEGGRQLISTIRAINFFGEMAIIEAQPRSATVVAHSRTAVVYAFKNPNLHVLLAHPTWGAMLLARLSADLREKNAQLVALQGAAERARAALDETAGRLSALRDREERLERGVLEVLGVLSTLQRTVVLEAVVNAREWKFLVGLEETVQRLVQARMPDIAGRIVPLKPAAWTRLREEGVLPEILHALLRRAD